MVNLMEQPHEVSPTLYLALDKEDFPNEEHTIDMDGRTETLTLNEAHQMILEIMNNQREILQTIPNQNEWSMHYLHKVGYCTKRSTFAFVREFSTSFNLPYFV